MHSSYICSVGNNKNRAQFWKKTKIIYLCKDIKEDMILIADCGSTKTDWTLCCGSEIIATAKTQGFNPTHQESEEIYTILSAELTEEFTSQKPNEI